MDDTKGVDRLREELHRQMLSTVSHDLKTPLATIIGSLDIVVRMGERLGPDKKDMLLHSALAEAHRLDRFITNILDMAKLEGGMVKPRVEPCDLRTLVQDCIARLGPRAGQAQFSLPVKTDSVVLSTDVMLLSRAIGQLLDNALRHAGPAPLIQIAWSVSDGKVMIGVADNGPGIQAGQEEAIFSKYTRLAKADQQNAGTGLGLAISRAMVTLLGGHVSAVTLPQGGARFCVTVPQ